MPPSVLSRAICRLRISLRDASQAREALYSRFQPPPLPPPPPQRTTPPLFHTAITSYALPDAVSLVRFNADTLIAETLLRWRTSTKSPMTAFGDSLLLFRTNLRQSYLSHVARTVQGIRGRSTRRIATRIATQSALCSASTGMGLAALVAQEQRQVSAPVSLLRLLSSTKGPQRLGIGWLPAPARMVAGGLMVGLVVGLLGYVVVVFPHAVPWLLLSATVCFAARPDLDSFRAWTKRCAPMVAKKKTMLLDKVRAQMAPYMMRFNPPVLDDYGLFSVVTVIDAADYVYVYAGFLSRWILLGWYNIADDYNFDKIRAK